MRDRAPGRHHQDTLDPHDVDTQTDGRSAARRVTSTPRGT